MNASDTTSTGVSYMLACRAATKRALPTLYREHRVREVSAYPERLYSTLVSLGARAGTPRVAVLTPGRYNSAYYEHAFLAGQMGADLLRVCGAYELYCRRYTMTVRRGEVLDLMIRDPEVPRSLRFALHRIESLLVGIDPLGNRHPLAPPQRMALRLAAVLEADAGGTDTSAPGEARESGLFERLAHDGQALHERVIAAYVDYPVEEGLPA